MMSLSAMAMTGGVVFIFLFCAEHFLYGETLRAGGVKKNWEKSSICGFNIFHFPLSDDSLNGFLISDSRYLGIHKAKKKPTSFIK